MEKSWKFILLTAAILCIYLSAGCGKDDNGTGPDNSLPSVSVTVGTHQPTFPATGATYAPSVKWLLIGFDQGQLGQYPIALISIFNADSIAVGNPAECTVSIAIDTTMQFICGSSAQNDSSVAEVTFTRLELSNGGRLTGDITGRAERQDHPEEGLSTLQIHFSNIPVIM